MGWFIFSEVMFFAGFFGALFYARVITTPMLGDFDHRLLWPDFTPAAERRPGRHGRGLHQDPGLAAATINTILLVTSGIWLTIAHHALRANHRGKAAFWLFMTLLFGFTFVGIQAYEYMHAYRDLNLRLDSGIFGSTFFMLTGLHGFHVLVGAIMLTVVLLPPAQGALQARAPLAFEAAAWYWHFVDVVWIGLYITCTGCSRPGRRASENGARGRRFCSGLRRSAVAARLDPAHPVAEPDEQQQQHRKGDADRQGVDGAVGRAAVAHQEQQRRAQRDEDAGEGEAMAAFMSRAGPTAGIIAALPRRAIDGAHAQRGRAAGRGGGDRADRFSRQLAAAPGRREARAAGAWDRPSRRAAAGGQAATSPPWPPGLPLRVQLRGRFLFDQELWLDNRQMDGQAGLMLVTPLRLADGAVCWSTGASPPRPARPDAAARGRAATGRGDDRGLAVAHTRACCNWARTRRSAADRPFGRISTTKRSSAPAAWRFARWIVQQTGAAADG